MKLIDLVKRVESAGLEIELRADKKDNLVLLGWTVPTSGDRKDAQSLFIHVLPNENITSWAASMIIERLGEAAKHPDAVARRELMAVWAKEDEADAKKFRGRHAA